MGNLKKDIKTLSFEQLAEYFESINEKKFRAKQVYEWIWKKSVQEIDEMTNLSKTVRDQLNADFTIGHVKVHNFQKSADKTIKSAFELADGKIVEGVLIPTSSRMTACISSQVGCSLTCKFCATGRMKRLRNLEAYEIYEQVVQIKRQAEGQYNIPLSNIVYMGMGEPLLNYRNVLQSIEMITTDAGLGMAAKRITVSTAGIAKMIQKMGDDQVRFNLALSLHAADDQKRDEIMPINEQNSLESLSQALRYFYDKTGTRITYEYIVFKDFNDSVEDAAKLATFCKNTPCKINIIEYNPIDDGEFQQTTEERLNRFVQHLESKNLIVNVRRSRGKDIDAACGQLANKH